MSEKELSNYMPPLEESCKVKFGGDWETYKRFESKNTLGNSFVTMIGNALLTQAQTSATALSVRFAILQGPIIPLKCVLAHCVSQNTCIDKRHKAGWENK